jgi:hypothetical protein
MSMHQIAALFVRRDSIYKTMPGVDAWDEDRDARLWPGGCPVVAHPPCRTWGKLKAFAKAPPGERELAILAVDLIRRWGGVLEHPAASDLWREITLPAPSADPDDHGGWTLECDQFHWGHLARKRTRLYIVGVPRSSMPDVPFREGEPTHCVSSLGGRRMSRDERRARASWKPELGPNRRDVTPPAFAEWLVEVARRTWKP